MKVFITLFLKKKAKQAMQVNDEYTAVMDIPLPAGAELRESFIEQTFVCVYF